MLESERLLLILRDWKIEESSGCHSSGWYCNASTVAFSAQFLHC